MTSLAELRFFTTPPHECSYLPNREATTLFVDPMAKVDKTTYSVLSEAGFRRSGNHIYRPYCEACAACIPVRVPAASFHMNRRQRRIWKKNLDLVVAPAQPAVSDEYFDLYRRYINQRHADGDMYPADLSQFRSFLVEGRPEALFYELRHQGRLVGVAVVDELDNALSAIYTFFEPDLPARSLGVFAVLWLLSEAKRRSLAHVYLGYWIKDCQKMSYKSDYQPLELLSQDRWVTYPQ